MGLTLRSFCSSGISASSQCGAPQELAFESLPLPQLTPHSIWKPLKGPVRDWPLALCDAKTIDAANDLVVSDVVYQDHSEENYQVHYNPKQRWLYLSDQQPSEMLVFRCADSLEEQVGPGEIMEFQN